MDVKAEVKLPAFFSDGMVMQQQSDANLWGTALANKTVKITTSWDGKVYQVKANSKGQWKGLTTSVALICGTTLNLMECSMA